MTSPVAVERAERRATVTLDRPPLNILDLELLAAFETAIGELAADSTLALVVLRGGGTRAFSAGVSVADHTPDKIDKMLGSFHGGLRRLREIDALTVAAVDGHCLGGGLELARVCDWVVATDRSRFGQPEIQLGCFPPVAAALYPSRLGAARTLDLLVSGRTVGAAEAETLGWVDFRVADGGLDAKLAELADTVLARSAAVVRLTKRAVRAGAERPFAAALAEAERLYLRDLAATDDMREGLAAFVDKRPPRWSHR
ncbi:MAG: enoyl-CoA hydratase/isomerase family protein [Thermoanaerobaculia bacterium]